MVIDSKLRGCDLVKLKVAYVYASGIIKERVSILQSMTQTPGRFEITEETRKSLIEWIRAHPRLMESSNGKDVRINKVLNHFIVSMKR